MMWPYKKQNNPHFPCKLHQFKTFFCYLLTALAQEQFPFPFFSMKLYCRKHKKITYLSLREEGMFLYICATPRPTKGQKKGQLVTFLPRSPTIIKDSETFTGIS